MHRADRDGAAIARAGVPVQETVPFDDVVDDLDAILMQSEYVRLWFEHSKSRYVYFLGYFRPSRIFAPYVQHAWLTYYVARYALWMDPARSHSRRQHLDPHLELQSA